VVWQSTSAPLLARLDPLSLQVIPPQLELVEYHYAYSFSPDGAQLALGLQARVGVRIVDLARMQVAHDIPMPIAVEALAWLEPQRLVAVTQSGDVALVDPVAGKVLARRSLPLAPQCTPYPQASARTRLGLVLVIADHGRAAPVRVVVIDARGRPRMAVLRRIVAGPRPTVCERAGLAVDLTRARAYVVAPGGLVAEVDLQTMHVRSLTNEGIRTSA